VSRLIVVVLFFVAVFVGLGLGAIGVPSEVAIASGLLVTGAALLVASRRPPVRDARDRLPVNLVAVGGGFAAFGALLFIVGIA
jgi:hypothetical protein